MTFAEFEEDLTREQRVLLFKLLENGWCLGFASAIARRPTTDDMRDRVRNGEHKLG